MKNHSKTVPECIWLKHLRIQWSSLNIILLGEAHWLKPPSLTRQHSNRLHELFYTGGPGKEHGTISHRPPEAFGKGQKETPRVRPPPRILLSGVHLGWRRQAPPGRTLSQNDWPKTTRKLIPSPENPRLWPPWQSDSPGFPHPPALHPGTLSR